jgi:transcriptional regulator with XRE-family HTH domain
VDVLKEMRLRKGWSQQDLANRSGVGQDTISGIELGRHEPRPSTLRKLAGALDVEVADFFREEAGDPKAPAPPSSPEEISEERRSNRLTKPESVSYEHLEAWRVYVLRVAKRWEAEEPKSADEVRRTLEDLFSVLDESPAFEWTEERSAYEFFELQLIFAGAERLFAVAARVLEESELAERRRELNIFRERIAA